MNPGKVVAAFGSGTTYGSAVSARIWICVLGLLMSALWLACSDDEPNDERTRDAGRSDTSANPSDGAASARRDDESDSSRRNDDDARDAASSDASATDTDAGGMCVRVDLEPPAFDDERALHAVPAATHAFFRIAVRASDSHAPLAGAELETVNHIVLRSDVNGVIAFYEPGLMDREVYFDVRYPGYQRPADGFGYHGVRLQVSEGGSATVDLDPIASATAPTVTGDLQTRLADGPVPGPDQCYAISVVDGSTGRAVPLVRVEIGADELWSDSDGLVAYCDPDRVGQRLSVHATSHGYGGRTAMLDTSRGGFGEIKIDRVNVAERLYRITGEGIYRDSILLGRDVPLQNPVLDGQVMGQDTVQATLYQDEIFWVWGDTQRPSYPLGNFHTSSARSELPDHGGLPPSAGIDLAYFVGDDGFSKPMAPPETVPGDGVTWLGSLIAVPDHDGRERLFARYALVPSGTLMASEIGIVQYDDDRDLFVKALALPSTTSRGPDGHPTRWLQPDGEYVYYQPPLRIPATAEAMVDPARYEVFTALEQGSSDFERDGDGDLAYSWKTDTDYVTRAALQTAGIDDDQALDGHLRDPDGGETIDAHSASSRTWNAYRQRFTEIVQQIGGDTSYLGEIWYAEGDTPMGPWVYARKVVTHDDYTFYNPRQHPFFDQQGGRRIYFEGTYVTTFASNEAVPTPRYDYNQLMYRLDLDDPRLNLPVAVYERIAANGEPPELVTKADVRPGDPALRASFFALDRLTSGMSAVSWSAPACRPRTLVATRPDDAPTPPLFYAMPYVPGADRLAGSQALYAFTDAAGAVTYALEGEGPEGAERADEPLAYVWPSPLRVRLPIADYLGELVAFAGEDQCVPASADGRAAVSLDASGSRDLRGPISRWLWTAQDALGCKQVEGEHAELELPAGTHVIALDVWDDAGNHDRDELLVDVMKR
jgi:hypothetical protein